MSDAGRVRHFSVKTGATGFAILVGMFFVDGWLEDFLRYAGISAESTASLTIGGTVEPVVRTVVRTLERSPAGTVRVEVMSNGAPVSISASHPSQGQVERILTSQRLHQAMTFEKSQDEREDSSVLITIKAN